MLSTRAAARAFSSGVSPGTATNVPLDCSPAMASAAVARIERRLDQIVGFDANGILRHGSADNLELGEIGEWPHRIARRPSPLAASRIRSNILPLGPATSDSSITVPG